MFKWLDEGIPFQQLFNSLSEYAQNHLLTSIFLILAGLVALSLVLKRRD